MRGLLLRENTRVVETQAQNAVSNASLSQNAEACIAGCDMEPIASDMAPSPVGVGDTQHSVVQSLATLVRLSIFGVPMSRMLHRASHPGDILGSLGVEIESSCEDIEIGYALVVFEFVCSESECSATATS